MDIGSFGISGGSGLMGVIVGFLTGTKRMDRIEKELDQKITKDTCEKCNDAMTTRLDRMENKIDRLLEK